MTKIQYENLTIRQAEVADAKQLAAWWNDGAVMAHAGFPNGLGTTEEEIIERFGNGCMVIEESDRLIGECNYRNIADGVAEIGIKICETDYQNRGVGRKVLSMLIGWLFRNGYSKIVLDTNLTNTRAQHVYICSSRYFRLTRPFIVMYPFAAISSFNFLMILYASDWDTPNIFTTSSALINKHSAMF